MELLLLNTDGGLKPCYDEDYDNKKKLKLGQIYKAKITIARNIDFHRKYFALINCAWAYQNEKTTAYFKNDINSFRKTIEVAAGHCDTLFNLRLKEWVDVPKSIAFDKMDELEFRELYDRVKDIIFSMFIKNVSEEEFMNNLINF
jgi:hypothetical protein